MDYMNDDEKIILTLAVAILIAIVVIILTISSVSYIHYEQEVEACLKFVEQNNSAREQCFLKLFEEHKGIMTDKEFELEKIRLSNLSARDCSEVGEK